MIIVIYYVTWCDITRTYNKAYNYGYMIWKTVKNSRYIIDIKIDIEVLFIE